MPVKNICQFIPPPANNFRFTQKDNTCTLEHLRTRYNPNRYLPNHNQEERTVLCCNKCNHERGKKEELQVPLEERQKRSGRLPKMVESF